MGLQALVLNNVSTTMGGGLVDRPVDRPVDRLVDRQLAGIRGHKWVLRQTREGVWAQQPQPLGSGMYVLTWYFATLRLPSHNR